MSNDPLSQEIGSGDRPRCQEAMGESLLRLGLKGHLNILMIHLSQELYTWNDEGRPDLHELMAICTKLSDKVLDLEKEKDAQAVEILKLKNRIKKLERKAKSSIPPPKRRLYKQVDSSDDRNGRTKVFDDTTAIQKDLNAAKPVSTAGDAVTAASVIPDINTVGPSNVSAAGTSTSTAGDIFKDEMMTIADTLVAIRSTRPRTTLVIAQRLLEEDQAQFEREQRIARERAAEQEAKDVALIEQMEDVQARMDADILLAEILQQEEREQFTIKEKSRMLVDMIAEGKRFFVAQRAAKQRSKPPTKAQMRNRMCTYLKNQAGYNHNQLKGRSYDEKDDGSSKQAGSRKKRVGSNLKPKSPKKLKVMKEQESPVDDAKKEELRACLDIVPKDDIAINVESLNTKYLIIFSEMLDDFDRQDVVDLYSLVKERYELISPEASIHMMVETKYPLTQEVLSRMLNRRLEVDHESTMAFELIRFIKAQLEE
ncbi:hypothetical protein Tco_0961390 [Tanacetum coccineum]